MPPPLENLAAEEDEEEEDDYLSMTFTETPKQGKETSLQRSSRLRNTIPTRGYNPPKSSPSLSPNLSQALPESNKGSQILSRMGFQPGQVLGKPSSSSSALKVPISVSVKSDKGGLGLDTEKKRKFAEETEGLRKRRELDAEEFVEGKRRERKEREEEGEMWRGMKVLEYFEEKEEGEGEWEGEGEGTHVDKDRDEGKREGLKGKNVLYRGLVKRRLEGEREKGMRGRIEGRLSRRLGGYEEDGDEGEGLVYGDEVEDEFEEEDEELEEFERGSFAERLETITGHLREKYRYCFWCGFQYPDEGMEGCPGLSREEHDEG